MAQGVLLTPTLGGLRGPRETTPPILGELGLVGTSKACVFGHLFGVVLPLGLFLANGQGVEARLLDLPRGATLRTLPPFFFHP